MNGPVETKVKVATITAALSSLVVAYVANLIPALDPYREYLAPLAISLLTSGATLFAAWWAKHTPKS